MSIPLYVAFNQAGAGHYSALSFRNNLIHIIFPQHLQKGYLLITVKLKVKVDVHVVTKINNLHPRDVFCCKRNTRLSYAVHAWQLTNLALLHVCASTAVTLMVSDQPKVVAPNCIRQKHAWQQYHVKSSLYAHHFDDKVTKGPHTQLEYLLLSQIVRVLSRHSGQREADLSLMSYMAHAFSSCQSFISFYHLVQKQMKKYRA